MSKFLFWLYVALSVTMLVFAFTGHWYLALACLGGEFVVAEIFIRSKT